ncbi:MAG: hypothetical protein M1833_003813 [Piccolia ochrophora]|nr:MAG: hypothetical protein M1833_003813 [Piccolia ochrophora]
MAWEHLSIDRPHLAYMILGGFTSLFMLVSLFVKERMYIGEATVATICGIIFGPHAANLFDPGSWGNVDQITLECSRVVLVVQCFAIGVELPKAYMERHWRSVTFLLVPVMTFGWLITSLFIWWMIEPLTWLESLACAACVTATDPVLASSVVGKGKFAKRVPKHLRDLLSAESGCNDGMAFPFIYLSLYLIQYRPDAGKVFEHWMVLTILYECIFGALYGFLVGYFARHAIKWAHRRELVDRESFLVFYFVLALFCAGSGALLGLDDLLVGFAAGVGFSNDGWFLEKTEESHVSNVIDLLLNLAYFVFFGAVIPWQQFNVPETGLTPWRLVVIAILVIFFRRIPIMVALKPFVPDIKTWREALFAGHFGPIGVGAIFVAILARAELETHTTTPLATLPDPGTDNYLLVEVIWPITTFLVISSILVHGSSIAVFTLGKHINTLTVTMSYTQANEEGPSWMNRLPRIQSQAKGSASLRKGETDMDSSNEALPEYPPGTLPPLGMPGNFLRRQKEDDSNSRSGSRTSSLRPVARKKKWDSGMGPGGPVSQSAITPQKRQDDTSPSGSDTLNEKVEEPQLSEKMKEDMVEPDNDVFQEGNDMLVEDGEGNVIDLENTGEHHTLQEKESNALEHLKDEEQHVKDAVQGGKEELKDDIEHPAHPYRNLRKRLGQWDWGRHKEGQASQSQHTPERKRGPALAYQFGNTIIVEDEDGEVLKKYDIPPNPKPGGPERKGSVEPRQRLQRMGTWVGFGKKDGGQEETKPDEDEQLRFVSGGRRLSKADFIQQIRQLDPKARCEAVNESDAPPELKQEVRREVRGAAGGEDVGNIGDEHEGGRSEATVKSAASDEKGSNGNEGLTLVDSNDEEIPFHSIGDDLAQYSGTAASRRREHARRRDSDSDDDGTERVPPKRSGPSQKAQGETAAERRRREAALSVGNESDSEDDDEPRGVGKAVQEPRIRFADQHPKQKTI